MDYLAFEQPMADLEAEIVRLQEANDNSLEAAERLRTLKQELVDMTREIYSQSDAVANGAGRPAQRSTAHDRLPVAGL